MRQSIAKARKNIHIVDLNFIAMREFPPPL